MEAFICGDCRGFRAGTLEQLVQQADTAGASDIHLQSQGRTCSVSFRLDGVMNPVRDSGQLTQRVLGRIKFLARLKTYQESLPQDGRIEKADLHCRADIRVATYPTVTGEKIVLRLFHGSAVKTLDDLNLPAQAVGELQAFLRQTSGLLLLTGPAGSGKTTTIYACLRALADAGGRHIITIEDPAEQIIPGIMQTEIQEPLGLDFAKAARHLLRQDPQVMVIGEIRDEETANIAIRAALTGHLVISTLHAGSCRGVFERLHLLSRDQSALAASIELVLNQRLIRRRCEACHGKGCAVCLQTGLRGRVPMVEWVRVTPELRAAISAAEFHRIVPACTLTDHAETIVKAGLTHAEEIRRVIGTG